MKEKSEVSSKSSSLAPQGGVRWTEPIVLAGFCVFLFYFGLASFGLVGADEPRYAQIAREMLERNDWVTPILYGKAWLEKPILYYWEAMISYRLFGVSDWAARIPGAFAASVMVAAVYLFVRRFRRGVQLDAALILASSAAVIGFGRAASTDIQLSASFTAAMLSWLAWHLTGRKLLLALFYAFLGLGVLAKGPVAVVLAGAIILSFAVIRRDLRILLRTLWITGILIFLVVALPWYVLVQVRTPEFFRIFLLQHNLARFGTNLFRHNQPVWYYAVVLPLSLMPWAVMAITGFVGAIRNWRIRENGAEHRKDADLNLYLLLWALVPLGFFSVAQSKLPGYILPAIPPFAIMVAAYLHKELVEGKRERLLLLTLHSLVASAMIGAALISQFVILALRPTRIAMLVATTVSVVVFVGLVATFRSQGLRALRFATLVPVILGLGFVLRVGSPIMDAALSARPVAQEIARIQTKKAVLAGFNIKRETEYGLAFYRNQPMDRYERAEIPVQNHLLVAGGNSEAELAILLSGRRITKVGSFSPQGLEFYWISTPTTHEMDQSSNHGMNQTKH